MRNEKEVIELNKRGIEETEQSIKDHKEVVVSPKNRVDMFKKRMSEYIVENGLIAYCIIMFSERVMLDIVMAEQLKKEVRE